MKGFVLLQKSFNEWEWYHNSGMVHLYINLMLRANYKECEWQGIKIERGSLITSIESLHYETRITPNKIRNYLKKMKTTNQITVKTTNKYTLIKIVGYDDLQNLIKNINNQMTNKAQSNNKQITTDNINNTNKEDKEDDNLLKLLETSINDNEHNILIKVIKYLNDKTGKRFNLNLYAHQKHIKARIKEKYTYDDFVKVIDNKYKDWHNDEKMKKYLRPETLFGNKFDTYLNDNNAIIKKEKKQEYIKEKQNWKADQL